MRPAPGRQPDHAIILRIWMQFTPGISNTDSRSTGSAAGHS